MSDDATLTAGDIARLVGSGQMRPTERFHRGPAPQRMRDKGAAPEEEEVLLSERRKCCPSCAPRYVVTTRSIEERDPRCCCWCLQTNHYQLTQVNDMEHRECCGWCCSTLSIQLDPNASGGRQTLDVSCTDTKAFFKVLRPRIGRVNMDRIQRRD